MKINLKDQKKSYQLKISRYYSFFIRISTKFLDKLNLITTIFESKIQGADKYFKYFFIFSITLFYIIFKTNFQTGMGGDDSRIYMFYPSQYLETAASNKRFAALEAENNQAGYLNTLKVMSILEQYGVNYLDFYFIIFFLGFIFFYLCLLEIQKKFSIQGAITNYFIFFLAVLYPTNPLIVDQVWNNHWNSIFTIPATPLVFLIFLKIIFNTINIWKIILLNLALTFLSIYFTSIVHSIATAMVLFVAYISYVLFNRGEFWKIIGNTFLFAILFIFTNIYWIYSLFGNYSGNPFITNSSNENAVVGLASTLDYYSKEVSNIKLLFLQGVNPNTNYDFIYYLVIILFYLTITVCLVFIFKQIISKKINDYKYNILIPLLFSFFTAAFLQSISLTVLGRKGFVFLAEIFFFLNGFRNYINKVPPTYSLFFLVIIFLIYYLTYSKNKILKYSLILSLGMFSIVSFRNLVLLEDYKFNLPAGKIRNTDFSSDSKDLFNYIKNDKNIERVVYIPLSFSTWSIYENGNQLYIGNSPITVFTGVDDFNGYMYIEQLDKTFSNYKSTLLSSYAEKDISNFLRHINYIGSDTLIINNKIDIDTNNYMGYEKTKNYENLIKLIKNNLALKYETPNKEFSVYQLDNKIISFKETIYNISNPIFNEKFYIYDFNNDVFVRDSLDSKYVNYNLLNFENQPISDINEIAKVFDSKQNLVEMTPRQIVYLNESEKEAIIFFENKKDNLVRVVIDSKVEDVSVKFGIENTNSSCSEKIFSSSICQIIKYPIKQQIGDKAVYTVNLINPTNKTFGSIKLKNSDKPIQDLNLKIYTASSFNNILENKNYNSNQKQELISNLFLINQSAPNYQIPKSFTKEKTSKDSYKVNIKLSNNKDPLIMTLNKTFSNKWKIQGGGIEGVKHFPANVLFNGWVIYPNSEELSLTITFDEGENATALSTLNDYSIAGSIIILIIFGIYGISKILIRKFWR